ncbi:NAD-dependent epimerase/dehydratase family protein [Baekduia soli]|uniref:NAD-dependent epimerase/dehydratase family protein n=1 Tax=Baekduia soli TaxID=496014 RepID=A0A5B8U463_9ACTN|nr:NAD(P)H-binding protein [Baekduia soli]QEC47668.1 NAD-dependent epimerase/dehydratase family protein [Baekduia soli]
MNTRAAKIIVLTGATGYVGGRLLPTLLQDGHEVRCVVRDPARADLPAGAVVVRGDVLSGDGLDEAMAGADVAYYLVHSMGGGKGDFAARDRDGARTFGAAAARAGVARTIYLGGLEGGDDAASEHLRSRHEVAGVLRDEVGAGLVYVRAAMIVGAGSTSFKMLRGLVERLPVMITPRWLETRSQPVAIGDVVSTLAALAVRDDAPDEVHLGGADVLTYREMLGRVAALLGRRQPLLLRVPFFTPRLSSYWVALVTPVELGLVQPLVEGLNSETVVRRAPPPGLNDAPMGFDDAVRAALAP